MRDSVGDGDKMPFRARSPDRDSPVSSGKIRGGAICQYKPASPLDQRVPVGHLDEECVSLFNNVKVRYSFIIFGLLEGHLPVY